MNSMLVLIGPEEVNPRPIIQFSIHLSQLLNYRLIITTIRDKGLTQTKQPSYEDIEIKGSEEDLFPTILKHTSDPAIDLSLVVFCRSEIVISRKQKATRFFIQCRSLKIPYLILPEQQDLTWKPNHIFFPVCNRDGEKEASAWCMTWANATNGNITLLHPHFRNTANQKKLNQLLAFITRLFKHSNCPHKIIKTEGSKRATIQYAINSLNKVSDSLLIIPATRLNSPEYIFTGPPELKLLKKITSRPILLVNPRHDLYLPCN